MIFAPFNSYLSSYFYDYNILKFCDIINIEGCAFINNSFKRNTHLQNDLNLYQNLMFTSLDPLVKPYSLFQTIILQDLEENQ